MKALEIFTYIYCFFGMLSSIFGPTFCSMVLQKRWDSTVDKEATRLAWAMALVPIVNILSGVMSVFMVGIRRVLRMEYPGVKEHRDDMNDLLSRRTDDDD